MDNDLFSVSEAVDRAKGINSGLDALVALLLGCRQSDIPKGVELAELIWCVQQNMAQMLEAASDGLKRKR